MLLDRAGDHAQEAVLEAYLSEPNETHVRFRTYTVDHGGKL